MARIPLRRGRPLALIFAALLVGASVGIATGAIPSTGGHVFYGCYDSGGNLKLIDNAKTTTCPKGFTGPVTWNQTGQAGTNGTNGTPGADGEDGAPGVQGPPGPSTIAALQDSPCSADGSTGVVDVTMGSGGATVPIDLACRKTPVVTATVTGGSIDITLRDQTLLDNQNCQSSCTRAFTYGHNARAAFTTVGIGGPATRFTFTCPPSSDLPGTRSSSGSSGFQVGTCNFSSLTADATVTATIP